MSSYPIDLQPDDKKDCPTGTLRYCCLPCDLPPFKMDSLQDVGLMETYTDL